VDYYSYCDDVLLLKKLLYHLKVHLYSYCVSVYTYNRNCIMEM